MRCVNSRRQGPSGQAPSVDGLCGNSSSFSKARLSDSSTIGCETHYEDTTDRTINCNTTTKRCNLLKERPFTACHSNIDPEPYVTACINTLCKYPTVDGLNCQFLEVYARACSLYNNDKLESWRLNASCSADPQAFCQDRFCSAHEFCGENSNTGGTRCYCRAIFASTYRSLNTFGENVVCNKTTRSVTLVGCLLEDKGILYSDLHLYDKTCRGEIDNETHMVTLGFDTKTKSCGTLIRMDNSQIIYKNGVILETTHEELMDLTCPLVFPEININFPTGIKIKGGNSSGLVTYITSGDRNYTLTMKAFTDTGRTQAVNSNTELHLNQRVWFEMKVGISDDQRIALVTDSCFATNEPSAKSSLKYNLIINGCSNPSDKSVIMEGNGQGTSNYFSFKMFKFSGKTGEVYLHCKLNLCIRQNNSCAPICSPNGRRRRSATFEHEDENQAIVIMAWSS